MDAKLGHRKYRLAAQLSADLGTGIGLWTALALVALLVVTPVFTDTIGEEAAFTGLLLSLLQCVVAAVGLVYLYRFFPQAISHGVTRRETLAAYAIFGLAVVVAAALLARTGMFLQDLFLGEPPPSDYYYGKSPVDSVIRPLFYFTGGALAAAIALRFGPRKPAGALIGLVFIVVLLRQIPLEIALSELRPAGDEITLVAYPSSQSLLVWLDLALACVFAAAIWPVLARAPLAAKGA